MQAGYLVSVVAFTWALVYLFRLARDLTGDESAATAAVALMVTYPFAFFYEMKRYLGVQTAISLNNLVDKLEVKSFDLSNGAKGGAGEDRKGGDAKKKR